MAVTVASPRSRSISEAITRAPARPKARAVARPIPAPAPVMTIDLPWRSSYIAPPQEEAVSCARERPGMVAHIFGRQVHQVLQSARRGAARRVMSDGQVRNAAYPLPSTPSHHPCRWVHMATDQTDTMANHRGHVRRDIRALMSLTDITWAVDAARITSVAWWTSAAGIAPNPRSG